MNIPFGKPVLGADERTAVLEVLDSGMLVHGKRIHEFEDVFKAFTGAPFGVGVASCTAALHLAYFHLGIGEGDEVIVPAQTHTATAHAVELAGATPVFVDAEPATGNIDISLIEAAITDRTKAISVVHYLGMPVDMHRVCEIAKKYDLRVIEDCALSLGAKLDGVHTGLFGDVGCFSFYPVKHMTTAEGGMLITRDATIASAIERKRAFGVDRHVGERTFPGQYDVTCLGYNYRMSELHAGLGIHQVKRLPEFLARRSENYLRLSSLLDEIEGIRLLQSSHDGFESSYYCHLIQLEESLADKRTELILALKELGVGTSIYYPAPVPHMTYYREKYGFCDDQFPVAASISYRGVALPVGPHVSVEEIDFIGATVKECIERCRR